MILKPSTVSSPGHIGRLAAHLLRTDENERAEVADVRGIARRDLGAMLRTMHRTRAATRGERGLFHVSINPDNDRAHSLTPEEWETSLAVIEAEFNLTAQPRVIVRHDKKQRDGTTRPHLHAVYQIADVERGRQCDWFENSGRRCGRIARELEQVLGHERQPERSRAKEYSRTRQQQAKRNGRDVQSEREAVQAAWRESRTAAEFQAAVRAAGFDLAEGRRGALLVARNGDHMALGRELKGEAAGPQIRERMRGHRLEPLESVQQRQRERAEAERQQQAAARAAAERARQAQEAQRAQAAREAAQRAAAAKVAEAERIAAQRAAAERAAAERAAAEKAAADRAAEGPKRLLDRDQLAGMFRQTRGEAVQEVPPDDAGKTPERGRTDRARDFAANRGDAFRQRFGQPKQSDRGRDDEPEHEL